MASSNAIEQIKKEEGWLKTARDTPKSKHGDRELSIGYGYNLLNPSAKEDLILSGVHPTKVDAVMDGSEELTKEQGDALLQVHLQVAEKDVKNLFPNLEKAPQEIKDALVSMSYQLGRPRLSKFEDMRAAVGEGDWQGVKKEMLDSTWAKQTPRRAKRLAAQVDKLPTPEKEPATTIGRTRKAQDLYETELHNSRVSQIASLLSRDTLVKGLADQVEKTQKAEAEAAEAKKTTETKEVETTQ